MATKKSSELKPAIWAASIFTAIILFCTIYASTNNNYPATYSAEVKSEVGEDGRAAVGAPAEWLVQISPATAWDNAGGKGWRPVGWVLLIAVCIFLVLQAKDMVFVDRPGRIVFIVLGLALACFFGSFSSLLASAAKKVKPEVYERIKDDKKELAKLFE
jgi:hypothetical protein